MFHQSTMNFFVNSSHCQRVEEDDNVFDRRSFDIYQFK